MQTFFFYLDNLRDSEISLVNFLMDTRYVFNRPLTRDLSNWPLAFLHSEMQACIVWYFLNCPERRMSAMKFNTMNEMTRSTFAYERKDTFLWNTLTRTITVMMIATSTMIVMGPRKEGQRSSCAPLQTSSSSQFSSQSQTPSQILCNATVFPSQQENLSWRGWNKGKGGRTQMTIDHCKYFPMRQKIIHVGKGSIHNKLSHRFKWF